MLELKRIGRPLMLALNMIDIARRRGITIDVDALSEELGVPVVTSIAVRKGGTAELLARTDEIVGEAAAEPSRQNQLAAAHASPNCAPPSARPTASSRDGVSLPARPDTWTARIDAVVLHPVAGW